MKRRIQFGNWKGVKLMIRSHGNSIDAEFVKSHLSKSKSAFIVNLFKDERPFSSIFQMIEFEDSLDSQCNKLCCDRIMDFDASAFCSEFAMISIHGSVNGLLFFLPVNMWQCFHYICNPVTREYIELPSPGEESAIYPSIEAYGFGISKMSGQYKVVRIIPKTVCRLYTLGTGSWRSITLGPDHHLLEYRDSSIVGAFVNGNLHWFVTDLNGRNRISCFDIETELFSTFSLPPNLVEGEKFVGVLEGFLCLCDNTSDNELDIWLMKEYDTVEKSWTKEGPYGEIIHPVKVFKNGDILMSDCANLYIYYSKTKSTSNIFERLIIIEIAIDACTPSFLSLKSFASENARSF